MNVQKQPLNPYDLCTTCGGTGIYERIGSGIAAYCPECNGTGNGESTRMRYRIAYLETENQQLKMDLDYEKSERQRAFDLMGNLPEENADLRESLHAAEMRNHAYASGEAIQDMAAQIGELETQLAAVPKWVKITDQRPPDASDLLVLRVERNVVWWYLLPPVTPPEADNE